MSLCDRCYAPGACCKGFQLYENGDQVTLPPDDTDGPKAMLERRGLPFEVMSRYAYRDGFAFLYSCPKLGPDGRCTIYKDRPLMCQRFEPESSPLCIHFQGAEGTGDGL